MAASVDPPPPGSLAPPPPPPPSVRRSRRVRPGVVVLGIAAALLLAAVVGVVLTNDDDGGLTVEPPTNTLPNDGTAAPTIDPGPDALRTIVIGDSGIAGGGARPYDPGVPKCFRSLASWPRQLQALLAAAGDDLRIAIEEDRSCGGASVDELLRPWVDRGEPAQIPPSATDPAADPDADLVLLGIGGNDYGIGELVFACFTTACGDAGDPAATARARIELEERRQELEDRLVEDVYPALREAYPNAAIVQVGYPRPTPAPGRPIVECDWLTDGEPEALAATVDGLNESIEAAVGRGNRAARADDEPPIAFVDVGAALEGHELCSADPWVHPIGSPEQVHTNNDGYGVIAELVAARLPAALDR